ncbi:S8 family serine peptidase [Paenibacillus durus]|uniref:Peptidase S8/S53 domain-containing protein n=1 Tax=Paenibacillus durus TaxID=44251 RepID=A0A089HKV3_PAEDU|nr:S8 family serine peptidase [Paenibacillus durus]AIQ11003.1 hypothetical protein PDUR_02500 [Paenibacillus durus]
MNKIKVAIIDSGIDMNHPCLSYREVTGIKLIEEDGNILFKNCIIDSHGHGTAVAGIIFEKCSEVDLLSIGILDGDLKCKFTYLKAALQFAINADVQIINLSLGTVMEKYKEVLKSLCDEAERKGIFIVAAVNNDTNSSYPADFPNVFGVRSKYIIYKHGFVFNPNGLHVYANGFQQKVCSKDGAHLYVSGNSFAAAHFTGILANIIYSMGCQKRDSIIEQLIKARLDLTKLENEEDYNHFPKINKGLLFPINEENIERIRLHQKGDPEIIGFYDYRTFYFDYYQVKTPDGNKEVRIYSSLEEGLEKADTLLIGDVSFISYQQKKDLLQNLIKKAITLGKNVLVKDAFHPDEHKELYELAKKKGKFIKSKYI